MSASPRPASRRRFLGFTAASATLLTLPDGLLAQDPRLAHRSPLVSTHQGLVQGLRYHGSVSAYYGLPYAGDTGGAQRFQAPPPAPSWSGVREAVSVGARAPQTTSGPLSEVFALDRREPLSEDCLRLNVFTPAEDGAARPVMVWLHGGGFTSGSGGWLLYDGSTLALSQDVVVVTVNHRLNIFGHLHLAGLGGERYAASGNAGMLDIVAALEWVRDNIAAFGGDPGNVTVFGQSGGAGKVSTLLAMPAAKGLFHKAIAMSGANLSGIPADQASATAERFLGLLGLDAARLDRLDTLPMEQLLAAYLDNPGLPMAPVLDGLHLPAGPFAPEPPAQSADVPLLLGTTEHEVNFMPGTPLDPIDEATLLSLVTQATRREEAGARELVELYRQGRPQASAVELYQIIASDNSMRRGVIRQAEIKAGQGGAPTFLYYFRWPSPVREGKLRAYHCLDIPFAFNHPDLCGSMTGAGQYRYALADRLSGAFAAFARTGRPAHPELPGWRAFDAERRATMVLGAEGVELVDDPFGEERRALYG